MANSTTDGTYQPTVIENNNIAGPQNFPPGPAAGQGLFGANRHGALHMGYSLPQIRTMLDTKWDVFHHISCMPQYANYSPEELRVLDYSNDRVLSQLHSSSLVLARFRGRILIPAPPVHIARTYTRYGGAVVTFEVGKDDKTKLFAIHESLISHRSDFVRLALQNDWKEAKERKIPLPDDEPDIFEVYQIFLYDRDIYMTDDPEQYARLVKAYLLGEKLLDIGFKNAIIDAFIIRLRNTSYFDLRLTNLIYDHTPETSPLRILLRDIYVWVGSAKWFHEKDLPEPINGDFLRDVNEGQFQARQSLWEHAESCPSASVPAFLDDVGGWGKYHERVEAVQDPKAPRKSITPKGWKVQTW